MGKYTSVTVTYLNGHGEHQFLTRTFPIGGTSTPASCANPDPSITTGYIGCSQSEGIFRQNQLTTSVRLQTPKGTSLTGFYSANWANSNTSGITNPYNSAGGLRAGRLRESQPDDTAGDDPAALPDYGQPDHAGVVRPALQHYDRCGQ